MLFNHYPANTFCHENVVCLLHLLSIFKCTPDNFDHRSKHYEPWSRGYKTFVKLNLTEHEISTAHKNSNSDKCRSSLC